MLRVCTQCYIVIMGAYCPLCRSSDEYIPPQPVNLQCTKCGALLNAGEFAREADCCDKCESEVAT